MKPTSKIRFAALTGAVALIVPAGCGSSSGSGGDLPDFDSALAGAPPPLAALYERGDAIIERGTGAFEAELAKLEGYPVVVNVWASWCVPCRAEFAHFQAVARGTEVAFLGVLANDSIEAGETFLRDNPLPYPSFHDPDAEIVAEVGNARMSYPSTSFYDADGELVFTKIGPYTDDADLEADIAEHALGA